MLAVVFDGAASGQDALDDRDVFSSSADRFAIRNAMPPFNTCGPETPRPSSRRPPVSRSIVAAVIAVIAGVRAGICMTAVPTLMRSVLAASQTSGVTESEP